MNSVFDTAFSDAARSAQYRAWVYPELYRQEKQPRLENWHPEDLEAYCGVMPLRSGGVHHG